jgi:molecular chaperone GrpE
MSKKQHTDQAKEKAQPQAGTEETSAAKEAHPDKQAEEKSKTKKKKPSKAEELEEMKIQYAELNDKFHRLFADFDNYRKNCLKDKLELVKNASQELMESILPVLDDFDRAIASMQEHQAEEESVKGVELIYNKLFNILKQKGLQPMESLHKEFDTDYHDAITQIPAPSEDLKGKVVDVIQKGYLLNDKIIRHAKVVVGQ